MSPEETWHIEVAYATPAHQEVIDVAVRPGTTIEQTIRQSGMLARFPEIDLTSNPVGVFGVLAGLRDPVHDRDRVEIYRPLVSDPKETRRRRADRDGKKRRKNKKL